MTNGNTPEEQTPKTSKQLKEMVWALINAALIGLGGAVAGYAGGFIMPPSALYDRWFGPNLNNFNGVWLGSAGGFLASLELQEMPGHLLKGKLVINAGRPNSRTISVTGNHDSMVVLQGDWDAANDLHIGLNRKAGERFGPDAHLVLLVQIDDKTPALQICPKNTLDMTACRPFSQGFTILALDQNDSKPIDRH